MARAIQIANNGWVLAQTYSSEKGGGTGLNEPVLVLKSGKVVHFMDQAVSSNDLLYPTAAGMSRSGSRIGINAYDPSIGRRSGFVLDFQGYEK